MIGSLPKPGKPQVCTATYTSQCSTSAATLIQQYYLLLPAALTTSRPAERQRSKLFGEVVRYPSIRCLYICNQQPAVPARSDRPRRSTPTQRAFSAAQRLQNQLATKSISERPDGRGKPKRCHPSAHSLQYVHNTRSAETIACSAVHSQ